VLLKVVDECRGSTTAVVSLEVLVRLAKGEETRNMAHATTVTKAGPPSAPRESRRNPVRAVSETEGPLATTRAHYTGSRNLGSVRVVFTFEYSLPSEVSVVSSFIEKFMQLIANHRCVSGNEAYVEIALREALINAVVHGNHGDPRKHVHVDCRCEPDEISILVRDEGQGFDVDRVPDPTAPENIQCTHGRGIYLMRAYMDEVRFEEGGRAVRMRKRAPWNRGADSVKAGR
jgi:serine/threonine-protein kinase RsbW